jgi:myo-inositol-1(or 4)-monophosphatase
LNLENICNTAREIVLETGTFIKSEAGKFGTERVEVKGLNNFVTYVDKTSEQKLIRGLTKIISGAGFIAEEGTTAEIKARYRWVIDPLDGTTNFIHGLPPYSISVGLMDGDEVILGVIYEIYSGECFYAWKGSKAFFNDKEIHVTKVSNVKDSLIATGFPYYDFDLVKPYLESLEYFFSHSHGVRRIGSAAVDLAYVACGRFEAFYEYGLNPWDVAAGSIIIKQAGGLVSDFNGKENYIFGREIVAANANVFGSFLKIVNQYLLKK